MHMPPVLLRRPGAAADRPSGLVQTGGPAHSSDADVCYSVQHLMHDLSPCTTGLEKRLKERVARRKPEDLSIGPVLTCALSHRALRCTSQFCCTASLEQRLKERAARHKLEDLLVMLCRYIF